ncbi:MAG: GYDIA family GHMP kinase [Flavobacteriaceae bacterium]
MAQFYSNGKLLLTGEYTVLDGALALGLPTQMGQSLTVSSLNKPKITWKSHDNKGKVWLQVDFDLENGIPFLQKANPYNLSKNRLSMANTLLKILLEAQRMNPQFLMGSPGHAVETHLDFPRKWGLGSSSTLINNIAQWAQVDAYQLLWNSFGGSGYDIACAQYHMPILYQLIKGRPHVEPIPFNPKFKDHIYFVYLNKKKSSRRGILTYDSLDFDRTTLAKKISAITKKMIRCTSTEQFEKLLLEHELLMSDILGMPRACQLFPDYNGGIIKSLGAWGGDFVLVTAQEDPTGYFTSKGFKTVLPYSKMILGIPDRIV